MEMILIKIKYLLICAVTYYYFSHVSLPENVYNCSSASLNSHQYPKSADFHFLLQGTYAISQQVVRLIAQLLPRQTS